MKKLRIARRILLGIVILILVAIPLVAVYATATGWRGTCYGFTDGSWPCPWTEFFSNQLGYAAIFSFLPLTLFGGFWLVLTAIQSVAKKQDQNK